MIILFSFGITSYLSIRCASSSVILVAICSQGHVDTACVCMCLQWQCTNCRHLCFHVIHLFLQQQKQNVEDLQQAVGVAKNNYRHAMSNLEKISEEIHEMRKLPILPPREPGVGCDSEELFPLEINLGRYCDSFV